MIARPSPLSGAINFDATLDVSDASAEFEGSLAGFPTDSMFGLKLLPTDGRVENLPTLIPVTQRIMSYRTFA